MTSEDSDQPGSTDPATIPEDRLVYVIPQEAIRSFANEEITLLRLWLILWNRKWFIIGVTTIVAIASIAYALMATQWYRSTVLLAPAEQQSAPNFAGALGGLASLAGVSVGHSSTVEPLAVLQSKKFVGDFITANDLLPVFFPDAGGADSEPKDLRDGVRYFRRNLYSVSEDKQTSLVNVSVEWRDPEIAAQWTMDIVARLNERMRSEALTSAETNIAYLKNEMARTSVFAMQQSIGGLLEREMQKQMLARGNKEFAFKVLDPAQPPKIRSRPKRKIIVVFATFVGGVLAVLAVLLQHSIASTRGSAAVTKPEGF